MVHDSTRRPLTARVGARIDAFVVLAGEICRAIRANRTLGSATRRCTEISWKTRANGLTVACSALTVGPARGRLTEINVI